MSIRITKEYAGLGREDLLAKAFELGYSFAENSSSCSQSVVAALHELLGFEPVLVKAATSLRGGTAGQYLGTCGALAGGVIVLDYYAGRPLEKMSRRERLQENVDALKPALEGPKLLAEKFTAKYGSILCPHIERQLFGRSFYGGDPDEAKKKKAAQERTAPDNCSGIVGDVARWVMEIMIKPKD